MSQNGRASAAAALAVALWCVGSLSPVPSGRHATALAASGDHAWQPAATGSLTGVVVDADTGRPLPRARVILSSPALAESRVAITGVDGAYAFTRLPPAEYTLTASRTGFATRQYGERGTAPPRTVPLSAGQRATGIELALPAAGVIVGQILDEDRQPFAGARVEALVRRTRDGQVSLVTMAAAESDDRGAFRLNGLPAGQYYVSAFDPAFSGIGDETGPLTYAPTYYPGTPHLEEAARVTVVPGVEPSQTIVITLRIIRPVRVSGTIATFDQRRLASGAIIMSPGHAEGLEAIATRDVQIRPDGSFAFRNVPPGRYQIRARGEVEPGGRALFATFTVTVEGRDVDRLAMTLVPGATIEGSVAAASGSSPRLAYGGLRVRAPTASGGDFGDTLTGDVGRDGSFRIRGVMPGSHRILVEGLPDQWVLKSVAYRGQELTDAVLDVESQQELRDVTVVITDATTEVRGAVADERGREAARALVVFVPAERRFWTRISRRFRLQRTDGGGRYRIRGLPAGRYHALATYDLDESDAHRRDLVEDLVARAIPLDLEERARRLLDLRVVSLTSPPDQSR